MEPIAYAVNNINMLVAQIMDNRSDPTLTAEQFRMAKAALGVSNPEMSALTGLHRNTLNKADRGEATKATWALLRHTFESQGVEFISENGGGAGVRLKKPSTL